MKLVYRGGWHNVYCDGDVHKKTCNEYAAKINGWRWTKEAALARVTRTFKCDCSDWEKFNNMIRNEAI